MHLDTIYCMRIMSTHRDVFVQKIIQS